MSQKENRHACRHRPEPAAGECRVTVAAASLNHVTRSRASGPHYLWGKSAEKLLIAGTKAGPDTVPIRFIQIGSVSGQDITLPSAVLRSSAIQLMGSGIGSVPLDRMIAAIDGVLKAAVPAGFEIGTRPVPLSQVERIWAEDDKARVVFTVDRADWE